MLLIRELVNNMWKEKKLVMRKRRTGAKEKGVLNYRTVSVKNAAAKNGVVSEKSPAEKNLIKVAGVSNDLVASMNLDEMLEASAVIDMGLRGEKVPVVKSPKVRACVGEVLRLNENGLTKKVAEKMQQDLTIQIVERNKKTTDKVKARRLYREFMEK